MCRYFFIILFLFSNQSLFSMKREIIRFEAQMPEQSIKTYLHNSTNDHLYCLIQKTLMRIDNDKCYVRQDTQIEHIHPKATCSFESHRELPINSIKKLFKPMLQPTVLIWIKNNFSTNQSCVQIGKDGPDISQSIEFGKNYIISSGLIWGLVMHKEGEK